ncbi:LysM domain-containing protein [Stagonosporopsis vannaccii]|nr:LysM domain-containing protein [Stagonosporopsis vannaccii]
MKTTTTAFLFLSALISSTIATPVTPLQSRYSHIQLIQRASAVNSTVPSIPGGGSTLIIQEGDTLSSISAATGVGICDIAKANNIQDPNVIQAGATLQIPAPTGTKDDTSCLKTA